MAAIAEASAPVVSSRNSSVASVSLTSTRRLSPCSAKRMRVSKVQRTSAEASDVSISAQLAATPTARYNAPESR